MNRVSITLGQAFHGRRELYRALAQAAPLPGGRPAPINLDDLADYLREARIGQIVVQPGYRLDAGLRELFDDLNIRLTTPARDSMSGGSTARSPRAD